eukprot:1936867-Prymnesium_polylepis.1
MPQANRLDGRMEISLDSNYLTTSAVQVFTQSIKPLYGAVVLSASKTPLDDTAVGMLARAFPRLRSLYLSNTSVGGANLADVIGDLSDLHLLGLDGNALGRAAPAQLLAAMTKRIQHDEN